MLDHPALPIVLFTVETCGGPRGIMGKEAVRFVNCLGRIAAEIGYMPKGVFVRCAMQLLSVTVQRRSAKMHRRSGQGISREQGLRYVACFVAPVLMA